MPDSGAVLLNVVEPAGVAASAPLSPDPVAAAHHTRSDDSPLAAFVELAKPRITRLVTLTSVVGFGAVAIGPTGLAGAGWAWVAGLLGCAVGTALSSGGANALNQCMEARRDALMERTRGRPIPSRRVGRSAAVAAGLAMAIAGLLVLLVFCGPGAAGVSLLTMLSYLLLYTPLKPVTILNTWVGAVPGALPPMIGWSAASWLASGSSWTERATWAGLTDAGGWSLFLLMAVWQIPHFLAIAWMYRDDYARGGYRMLPIVDQTGRTTARQVALWSVLLVPATLAPAWALADRLSLFYAATAVITGVVYVALALKLLGDHRREVARRVFLASIVHLPLLLTVLVADGLASRFGLGG
jgi:protoheme IX farnesyltransferase